MSLRLDWVDHKAAKFACEKWHYSKTVPSNKSNIIGVFEDGKYIGCVIFGLGASPSLGKPYGLGIFECCELTRIALNKHKCNVSKIVSIAIRMLKKKNNNLKLIVSFADPFRGHVGIVYQACNWIYCGTSSQSKIIKLSTGEFVDPRRYNGHGFNSPLPVPKGAEYIKVPGKHRYLYPLTDDMRSKIEPLRKPYPKRASVVHNVEQPAYQQEEGGSIPTLTHTATGKEPVRVDG